MKPRFVLAFLLLVIVLESCHRSFTPYQAANAPRGKKCGLIR